MICGRSIIVGFRKYELEQGEPTAYKLAELVEKSCILHYKCARVPLAKAVQVATVSKAAAEGIPLQNAILPWLLFFGHSLFKNYRYNVLRDYNGLIGVWWRIRHLEVLPQGMFEIWQVPLETEDNQTAFPL